MDNLYLPEIYRIYKSDDFEKYNSLKQEGLGILCFDTIEQQLFELIKCKNASVKLDASFRQELIQEELGKYSLEQYGVWVYYPWNKRLIHLLDEKEFIEVRTNRNHYKITPEEHAVLATKKVGIIGLSVGQSLAYTLAMERTFGELRLADFDSLDLSNLNRIHTGVHQIGLSKAIISAREISELDPFLKVKIFKDGIDELNIDDFLTGGGKLDLLLEECDGLDIKILARHRAKNFQIPVVMETSDRGMLDIERFDLEPNRPVMHGLTGDLNPSKLKNLTQDEKVEYLLPMVGMNDISERMKASLIEVQNSISSWPQLASSVVMGSGVAAEMSRKILLGQSTVSGRFYVDLDQIIPEPEKTSSVEKLNEEIVSPISNEEVRVLARLLHLEPSPVQLNEQERTKIIEAAILAPSGGNCQPWKLYFEKGHLILIHDYYYSNSFLDFDNLGSYFAFGAMIENIRLMALELGYQILYHTFPLQVQPKIIATVSFLKSEVQTRNPERIEAMRSRFTNRNILEKVELPDSFYQQLAEITAGFPGAGLLIVKDEKKMNQLADLLSGAEKLLLLHPQGHSDIFNKELRFNKEDVLRTRDGLDIATLNVSKAEIIGLKVASSRMAIDIVDKIGGGEAFKKNTKKAIAASSCLGILSMPACTKENYFNAGILAEKLWIASTLHKISFQPVTQYSYLLARLEHGKGIGYSDSYKSKILEMKTKFLNITPDLVDREIVFIFRLGIANEPEIKSLRRNMDAILVEN